MNWCKTVIYITVFCDLFPPSLLSSLPSPLSSSLLPFFCSKQNLYKLCVWEFLETWVSCFFQKELFTFVRFMDLLCKSLAGLFFLGFFFSCVTSRSNFAWTPAYSYTFSGETLPLLPPKKNTKTKWLHHNPMWAGIFPLFTPSTDPEGPGVIRESTIQLLAWLGPSHCSLKEKTRQPKL